MAPRPARRRDAPRPRSRGPMALLAPSRHPQCETDTKWEPQCLSPRIRSGVDAIVLTLPATPNQANFHACPHANEVVGLLVRVESARRLLHALRRRQQPATNSIGCAGGHSGSASALGDMIEELRANSALRLAQHAMAGLELDRSLEPRPDSGRRLDERTPSCPGLPLLW